MLDVSQPQSQHIFAAARLMVTIQSCFRNMGGIQTAQRKTLLPQGEQALNELCALNKEHFSNSPFISENIEDLRKAMNIIAEAQEPRLDIILPPYEKLASEKGFGTVFI